MIKGEHDYLAGIAKINLCGECGANLDVATAGESGTFALRCGNDHWPDMIKRAPTLGQRSKQGEALPASATYSHLEDKDLATGDKLAPHQIQDLIFYAQKYGLDPWRGHVVIMHGQPYIGLDGYIYHARRSKIPFTLISRPLTAPERADYQVEKGDHAWVCEVTLLDTLEIVTGSGIVPASELTEMSKKHPEEKRYPVVAAHPWQMAQKRAEWQALRRAFPIGETEGYNAV